MAVSLQSLVFCALALTSGLCVLAVAGPVSDQDADCCWCEAWKRPDKTIQLTSETQEGPGVYALNQTALDEFVAVLNSSAVQDKEVVILGVVGELKWGKALNKFYRFLACVETDGSKGKETPSQGNMRWEGESSADLGTKISSPFSTSEKAVSITRQPFLIKVQNKAFAVFLMDVTGLQESHLSNTSKSVAVHLANLLSSTLIVDAPRFIPISFSQSLLNEAVKMAAADTRSDQSVQAEIVFLLRDHMDTSKLGWRAMPWPYVSQYLGLGNDQPNGTSVDHNAAKFIQYFTFPTFSSAATTDSDFINAMRDFFARVVVTNPSPKKLKGKTANGRAIAQYIKDQA